MVRTEPKPPNVLVHRDESSMFYLTVPLFENLKRDVFNEH